MQIKPGTTRVDYSESGTARTAGGVRTEGGPTRIKAKAVLAIHAIWAVGALAPALQPAGIHINLRVKRNGKVVPPPKEIRLSFAGREPAIPVVGGSFEAPPDVLRSGEISIFFRIGRARLHTSVSHAQFTETDWVIKLADKAFEPQYQMNVRPGAAAKSACVIEFSSPDSEGTSLFDPHCRE